MKNIYTNYWVSKWWVGEGMMKTLSETGSKTDCEINSDEER